MGKVVVESPLVHSLFKCSLCHGLIRSATVINECLHRFCKLCITNYFEQATQNTCPTCHITIVNPMETLKSDLTFQRLLYKLFPSVFQRETACKPSLLSPTIPNESPRIHSETTIDVYLEYWDISLELFPNSKNATASLAACYLECVAGTPLALIEKFIRLKHSLSSDLQVDLFYQTFLLNKDQERLIDVCYCFDQVNKNQTLNLRFLVSPFGYKAILDHIRRSKQPIPAVEAAPLQIEISDKPSPPLAPSSASSTSSSSCDSALIDPKLKVKIRRSPTATNDWYIPSTAAATIVTATPSSEPVELPDLVNSCETTKKITKRKQASGQPTGTSANKKKPCATSTFFSPGHVTQPNRPSLVKPRNKPRRRTRFIPTMVKAPPSIFDRVSIDQYDYSDRDSDGSPIYPISEFADQAVTTLRPAEMVIVNVEENVAEPTDNKQTRKTICKVPPYIPESATIISSPPEKSTVVAKLTPLHSPMRRTLLPKRIPCMIPSLSNRAPSPEPYESAPLDLSLK